MHLKQELAYLHWPVYSRHDSLSFTVAHALCRMYILFYIKSIFYLKQTAKSWGIQSLLMKLEHSSFRRFTYHTVGGVHAIQVYLRHKSDKRWWLWVFWPTFNLQIVHPVFIACLWTETGRERWVNSILNTNNKQHTALNGFSNNINARKRPKPG